MERSDDTLLQGLSEREALAARWDKVSFRAQGSPFEDLSVNCLAKNTGFRSWNRGSKKAALTHYIYHSFDELLEYESLDLRSATQLLEICEATFLFEQECDDLGSFEEIDAQATAQRMRFVEEYGLYRDYPVQLSNLDEDLRELCAAEEVVTFIDLMGFLDRLSDKAIIGGAYKNLQNVFAHGDERGLQKYFPYRVGHRGFHLPEALSFCLNRISRKDLQAVFEYHERRRRRQRLGSRRMSLPLVVETHLLPDVLECLVYFGRRQNRLIRNLHDSVYLTRELMYLNDPQTEGVLHWLLHLALGLFKLSSNEGVDEEVKQIDLKVRQRMRENLEEMVEKQN